jgi:hypothetical protein
VATLTWDSAPLWSDWQWDGDPVDPPGGSAVAVITSAPLSNGTTLTSAPLWNGTTLTSAPLSTGTTITDESRTPATAITSAPLTVTTISGSAL